MAKNINNLTSAIKAKINKYSNNAIISEEGKVISVGDGIVIVSGLNNVMLNEMVKFENGNYGMALNLEEDYTGIVMLGNYANIVENSIVKRTHKVISIGVGDAVSGRIINSLGEPIDGKGLIKYDHFEPIDTIAPGVMERQSVDKPLETGILAIDSMFPIGRGQRELIIGDRQTGKTSVAIDTIINQKNKSVHCVYVAIGQKNSSVVQAASTLATYGALSYTTIISATASDIPALKYIAPFSGMTIAEYWMKKGQDVLIIFDDLTKHARSYRAISLLLRRPPGREAYPGDIFYLHSRLLERAGRLNKDHGSGSITALPIIETQAGDISAYIPTNVISITDGQLFMIASLFNEGQRPAIDVGLSVSRVGSTAQIKAIKQVAGNLKLDLAQYSELSSFSQFGSDLDENTRDILEHGKRIMTMMKQPLCKPIDQIDQAILLLCVKYRLIKWIPTNLISKFSNGLITYFKDSSLRKKLAKDKKFDDKLFDEFAKEIKKQILKFVTGIKDYNFNKYGSKDEFAKLKIK